MSKARILIVEDEVIVREDLRDLLEDLGYEIAAAVVTGRDAVTKAAELRPDLVLMDVKLEDTMDGIEAAQQIREKCRLPVVFLTAFADDRMLDRAKRSTRMGTSPSRSMIARCARRLKSRCIGIARNSGLRSASPETPGRRLRKAKPFTASSAKATRSGLCSNKSRASHGWIPPC